MEWLLPKVVDVSESAGSEPISTAPKTIFQSKVIQERTENIERPAIIFRAYPILMNGTDIIHLESSFSLGLVSAGLLRAIQIVCLLSAVFAVLLCFPSGLHLLKTLQILGHLRFIHMRGMAIGLGKFWLAIQ